MMRFVWTISYTAAAALTTLPVHNGFQFQDGHRHVLCRRIATQQRRVVDLAWTRPPPIHWPGLSQPLLETTRRSITSCFMSDDSKNQSPAGKISGEFLSMSAASAEAATASVDGEKQKKDDENSDDNELIGQAATGTVNERLLLELQEAAALEKSGGARSSLGKKLGLDAFRSRKTDQERQAAIDEARDLNGVDPFVTAAGSVFALGCAWALWQATTTVGVFLALHPVESDAIFIQRTATVFRNIVVGLVSLASGFFGVTGLGILLLTFRVAYGVITGELDPTPTKKAIQANADQQRELSNVLDLMLNKRPKRRSNDKDNFGL